MKQPREFFGKRSVGAGLIAFGLLFSSFALANIVSGLSTTGSSTNVTITNLPMAKPSDVAAGDLMLASIAIHDGNTVTVTPPSGWTQVLRTDNDSNIGIATYEKIAGASEPANYTWVLSPQTRAQGGITRYSGVDTSNPIDISAGNVGRSKIATTSSVTTTAVNDEVVAVYALHVGSNNFAGDFFSTPTGMTEKFDSSYTTAGPTIASDDMAQATAGATGSISSTISGNPNQQRDWAAQTIALRMQPPTTLTNGLIAYWKLDGDSSDATGNGHNGSDTAITYSAANGIINQGAGFTVPSGSKIAIPDDSALRPTGSFTINAWVKISSGGDEVFQSFNPVNVAGIRFSVGSYGFDVLVGENTGTTNGVDYEEVVTGSSLVDNTLHMVTFVYDGSYVSAYKDGNPTPIIHTAWSGNPAYAAANYVRIGSETNTSGIDDGFTNGDNDEVGFWNRALSTSEISQLYNGGTGNQYPF